jgi:outer membrane protein OmpA-like peptidoglycan-associated protein
MPRFACAGKRGKIADTYGMDGGGNELKRINALCARAGLIIALAGGIAALPCAAQAAQSSPQAKAGPEQFSFVYRKGDKFRFLSEVHEDVYVNHRLYNRTEISNRIAFETADAAADGSWGYLKGSFLTAERPEGATAALITDTYDSEFKRDARGAYTIGPQYYMPVVRDLPIFPDKPVSPGDTWTAPGEERHDLRRVFGIPDPYAIPFVARYRYEGPVQKDGKSLRLVTADYTIFYQPSPPSAYTSIYPVQIAGFSDQKIYWDPAAGQIASYEERFKLIFDWSDGTSIEYRGSAGATLLEAELMDRKALAADVAKAVEGLDNVSVRPTDEGVTISIDNIQFQPDSSRLMPSEIAKLKRIAEILKRYPERDILVAGHTALAGTPEGRQKLSEERAQAVAEALIAAGAQNADRVQVVGYGAERPIADNSSEAGMAKNRRVEITILEN